MKSSYCTYFLRELYFSHVGCCDLGGSSAAEQEVDSHMEVSFEAFSRMSTGRSDVRIVEHRSICYAYTTRRLQSVYAHQWISTLPLRPAVLLNPRPCAYPRLIVRYPSLLREAAPVTVRTCSSKDGCWSDAPFAEIDAEMGFFWDALVLERVPRPPRAQLTSTPRLTLQSQTSAKTGVLIRTLRTGKMSGKRGGGATRSSATCTAKHAA